METVANNVEIVQTVRIRDDFRYIIFYGTRKERFKTTTRNM